jgi:hypothetical protein
MGLVVTGDFWSIVRRGLFSQQVVACRRLAKNIIVALKALAPFVPFV